MKEIKTGAEIWEIIKHPEIAYMEKNYDPDRLYEFETNMKKNKRGIIISESKLIPTEEEQQKIRNQEEINELNNWLDLRRNIEHPDKASKQARLLELLG